MEANQKLNFLLNHTGKNVAQFSKSVGQVSQTFYDINKGKVKSFSPEVADKICKAYPEISYLWLTRNEGSMILPPQRLKEISAMQNLSPNQSREDFEKWLNIQPRSEPQKTDKKADALEQLKKVTSKTNVQKNANEGTEINDDHLVPVKTYIIPIKGFAGLRKHFFTDEYIRDTFEETMTYIHKSERVPELLKIQADGNSMPPLISPGDHVLCEPIQDITIDYKFKPDKIYCFFHHSRGILFKRAENKPFDQIELSSDNPDKIEYPNEIFDIGEFKKISIVRTIEKKV